MSKKQGIRKLFDNIAADYDKLNHILSLNIDKGWRRRAVRQIADVAEPLRVLDVACGTADFTIEIARKLVDGSKVVGVDISEGMMQIGRDKVAKAAVAADIVQGDCEALVFDDNSFDRVTVAFGVRNFENLMQCLGEMNRVLKSGGKMVVLELSIPSNAFIRWCYKLYFFRILPVVGGWLSGNRAAYEYLPASVQRFPAPENFISMINEAGFKEAKLSSFTFGICRMYVAYK